MSAVVWKSNHDRLKREQESEQQLQQHMKKNGSNAIGVSTKIGTTRS